MPCLAVFCFVHCLAIFSQMCFVTCLSISPFSRFCSNINNRICQHIYGLGSNRGASCAGNTYQRARGLARWLALPSESAPPLLLMLASTELAAIVDAFAFATPPMLVVAVDTSDSGGAIIMAARRASMNAGACTITQRATPTAKSASAAASAAAVRPACVGSNSVEE